MKDISLDYLNGIICEQWSRCPAGHVEHEFAYGNVRRTYADGTMLGYTYNETGEALEELIRHERALRLKFQAKQLFKKLVFRVQRALTLQKEKLFLRK